LGIRYRLVVHVVCGHARGARHGVVKVLGPGQGLGADHDVREHGGLLVAQRWWPRMQPMGMMETGLALMFHCVTFQQALDPPDDA